MKQGRPALHAARRNDWIHARVTKEQAEKVRELGGSQFLRDLIEEKLSQMRPARIEDVWRRA
jgi:hypothetical protein